LKRHRHEVFGAIVMALSISIASGDGHCAGTTFARQTGEVATKQVRAIDQVRCVVGARLFCTSQTAAVTLGLWCAVVSRHSRKTSFQIRHKARATTLDARKTPNAQDMDAAMLGRHGFARHY
jgi:hypothetical protein